MAFAVGGKGGAQSDINVTPLVDVVLVLLIIFMVVTPLLQVDMPAQVPKQEPPPPSAPPPPDVPPIVISVRADGIYLNLDKVTDEQLAAQLKTMRQARTKKEDQVAFISGEQNLNYAQVVHAMDIARGAGFEDVGIIDPLQ
jgi:biopolymer transport protein TolR